MVLSNLENIILIHFFFIYSHWGGTPGSRIHHFFPCRADFADGTKKVAANQNCHGENSDQACKKSFLHIFSLYYVIRKLF